MMNAISRCFHSVNDPMAEREEQHTGADQRKEQSQAARTDQGLRPALQHVRTR